MPEQPNSVSMIGDGSKRFCPRCKAFKPHSSFNTAKRKRGHPRDGLQTYCKPCHREYQHDWYMRNRTKSMAASRRSMLRRFYGMNEDEWNERWETQGGKCLITEREMARGSGGKYRPCVDHFNDANGLPVVRGLITHAANAAIALLDHDPETCIRAAEYLYRYELDLRELCTI